MIGSTNIRIEPHFAGNYRLEYDGKYITLLGCDRNYPCMVFYGEPDDDEYEVMVLVPVVLEVRNAEPEIKKITPTHIVITY